MPKARPLAIEKVNGIIARVRKAGIAISGSSQAMSASGAIISAPTRIKAGAVAASGTSAA